MLEMYKGACMSLVAAAYKQAYFRVCEASCRDSVVVQHVLTPTHVLHSADALCTGSMCQHVFACKQAQAHVNAVHLQLQIYTTGEHANQDQLSEDTQCSQHLHVSHPHVSYKLAGRML